MPTPATSLPPPFPERWPAAYRRRALSLGPGNPLEQSGAAHPAESDPDPGDRADPTGERALSPVPFAVRKHRDRVLVLAAGRCFLHCRFCFRRGQPERFGREPGPGDWQRILAWLADHPEVQEVILSGGDPLTLPDRRLAALAADLARVPSLRRWRIHTRAPVVAPGRVTRRLLEALTGGLPLRVICHANHAAELDPPALGALARLRGAGVGLGNQGVLLRGVNDEPAALLAVARILGEAGVAPHYWHHPDPAPGTGRFRLSLARGLAVHREFARRAATAGREAWVAPYVVDLPCGAGKTPVASLTPVGRERRGDQMRVRYRWERPAGWDGVGDRRAWEWWDVWEPVLPDGLPAAEA